MSVFSKKDLENYSFQSKEIVKTHEEYLQEFIKTLASCLAAKYKTKKGNDDNKPFIYWFSPYLWNCELPENGKEYYLKKIQESFPEFQIEIKEFKTHDYNVIIHF